MYPATILTATKLIKTETITLDQMKDAELSKSGTPE